MKTSLVLWEIKVWFGRFDLVSILHGFMSNQLLPAKNTDFPTNTATYVLMKTSVVLMRHNTNALEVNRCQIAG